MQALVELQLHSFFTSALHGGELSTSPSDGFTAGTELPVHMKREAGRVLRRSGRFGEDKNLLPCRD